MDERKIACITGASRGIGRGIALALSAEGYRVVVHYKNNAQAAQTTLDDIQTMGGDGMILQADLAVPQDRQEMVSKIEQKFGRIDILVNNAGMAPKQRADMLEMTEASYDEVMAVNLKGPFFLTQVIAKWMIELSLKIELYTPMIVNIGSISAYTSSVNRGEYCISKAGMGMMTALFADRLAEQGILVYEIRPGIIDTEMTSPVKAKYDGLISGGLTPIRRWGLPEDIGKAVAGVASGALPFSTGEIINVDGGFHLRRL